MAHTNMVEIEGVSFELAAFLSRLLTPILETPTSLWSDLCVAFERERNIVEINYYEKNSLNATLPITLAFCPLFIPLPTLPLPSQSSIKRGNVSIF